MKNPCVRDCPERSVRCHVECGAYIAYASWCEEQRQARKKMQAENYAADAGLRRNTIRKQKRDYQNRK